LYVIEHPDIFGMPLEEIKTTYRKHHEKLGFEGTARREIIISFFRKGWIRVRHKADRAGDRWLFEFSKIKEAGDPIMSFITEKSYEEFLFFAQAPIELHGIDDGYRKYFSMADGGASGFVEEYVRGDERLGPSFWG